MVCWLSAKLVQEPSVPGNAILGNALITLIFFLQHPFVSSILPRECCKSQILLCSLQKILQKWHLSYMRGASYALPYKKTTLEICQDPRLNMICFVCNQQLLRLVFTIRLSYLAQIFPFKLFACVTCVLSSSWWKNILFSGRSVQMSHMCIHRNIGLSDYFIWVTSLEIRTMQCMQVICGRFLTSAILPGFTGNTQITLILG